MLSAMLSSDRLSALHFHTLNQIKGLGAARLLDYDGKNVRFLLVLANNGMIVMWSNWLLKMCVCVVGTEMGTFYRSYTYTHMHFSRTSVLPEEEHVPPCRLVHSQRTQARAQFNSYQQAGGAESLFHWSMTAKPPSGTLRSPWQPQRFSGHEDVVNKSGESSANSGRSQAGAKWSVFPVNLPFLNPVKLRTLPKSHPQTSHITQNSKTIMHQCLRVM